MTFIKCTGVIVAGMATLIFASGLAVADEGMQGRAEGLHGSIGLGLVVMPEYEGSKEHKARVLPNINLFYGDSLFFSHMTAGANLLRFKTEQEMSITAGPLLALRRGRGENSNAALNGLGDIDTGLDAGGFINFRKQGWKASVDVRHNIRNTNQGTTVNFASGVAIPLNSKLRLRANVDATWASAEYMQTFFGIDALQSSQSGIAPYEAGAGFKHIGANLMAIYPINSEWSGFASLRYKRLLGDAANSPIVADLGSRDQLSASVGVKYRF